MEASTKTVLRCVALLSMLVLSSAALEDLVSQETVMAQGPAYGEFMFLHDPVARETVLIPGAEGPDAQEEPAADSAQAQDIILPKNQAAQGQADQAQDMMFPKDPAAQGPATPGPMLSQNKIKFLTCAKKCAISNALNLLNPVQYTASFGLCMVACKIPEQPTAANVKGTQATPEVPFLCTKNCISSMCQVMTTNARLTTGKDMNNNAVAKPTISDLHRYSEGYVDACYLRCNKNAKGF